MIFEGKPNEMVLYRLLIYRIFFPLLRFGCLSLFVVFCFYTYFCCIGEALLCRKLVNEQLLLYPNDHDLRDLKIILSLQLGNVRRVNNSNPTLFTWPKKNNNFDCSGLMNGMNISGNATKLALETTETSYRTGV